MKYIKSFINESKEPYEEVSFFVNSISDYCKIERSLDGKYDDSFELVHNDDEVKYNGARIIFNLGVFDSSFKGRDDNYISDASKFFETVASRKQDMTDFEITLNIADFSGEIKGEINIIFVNF